jgi:signal peptidase II
VSAPALRAWSLAGAICGLVFAADQAAKAAVEARLVPGEQIEVLGPLELTLTRNEGVAFGLAGGAGNGLVVVTLLALAAIGVVFTRNVDKPGVWIGVGLLAGGALGNLADRVRVGAVTDYVDVASWPAFNLADVAITCGVALVVLAFLRDAETEDGSG